MSISRVEEEEKDALRVQLLDPLLASPGILLTQSPASIARLDFFCCHWITEDLADVGEITTIDVVN